MIWRFIFKRKNREPDKRNSVVQGKFHIFVAEVEPGLQKKYLEHD